MVGLVVAAGLVRSSQPSGHSLEAVERKLSEKNLVSALVPSGILALASRAHPGLQPPTSPRYFGKNSQSARNRKGISLQSISCFNCDHICTGGFLLIAVSVVFRIWFMPPTDISSSGRHIRDDPAFAPFIAIRLLVRQEKYWPFDEIDPVAILLSVMAAHPSW